MVCLILAERGVVDLSHVSELLQQDTSAPTLLEAPVNVTGAARNSAAGRMMEKRPGVLFARGTEEGMEPDDLLCSRNARPQKALVRRAHCEAQPGYPLEKNGRTYWIRFLRRQDAYFTDRGLEQCSC